MTLPVPKTWVDDDALDGATLNAEIRDAFKYLLGTSRPGFGGYNGTNPYTFTSGVGVPLLTEEYKRGGMTHAASDSKVYVPADGWYSGVVQISINWTGATGLPAVPWARAQLKKNGRVIRERTNNSNSTTSHMGIGFGFTVDALAGDYFEISVAFIGSSVSLNGTLATAGTYPRLDLWWRSAQ